MYHNIDIDITFETKRLKFSNSLYIFFGSIFVNFSDCRRAQIKLSFRFLIQLTKSINCHAFDHCRCSSSFFSLSLTRRQINKQINSYCISQFQFMLDITMISDRVPCNLKLDSSPVLWNRY